MYTEGSLFDGRYKLKERKGRGSYGEVWLAEDTEIGVDFAIKIYVAMDQKGLEDFKKEYQLSCNLINSNLLHINKMEVSKEDGCPYLVMPYCPNGASSLVGRMSESDLWHFLHDVANGLAYLHEQNPPIIHQDIKPDNILQLPSGDFVITDFGISKQLRGTRRSAGGNSSGAVAYMGPERFKQGYTSIKSSDIWSLGATIYEMATGQLPFEGRGGKMQDMGFEIPVLPNVFSDELNKAMSACFNPEPWSRPSARQLSEYAGEKMKGRNIESPFVSANTQQQTSISSQIDNWGPNNVHTITHPAQNSSQKTKKVIILVACIFGFTGVVGLALLFLGGNTSKGTNEMSEYETEEIVPANSTNESEESVESEMVPITEIQETRNYSESSDNMDLQRSASESKPEPQKASEIAHKSALTPTTTSAPTSKTVSAPSSSKTFKDGDGNLSLSYGTYTGTIKNGYPNGKGKLVYTTSRQINKYDTKARIAEAGDYVEGLFVNGFFTTGKHCNANGEVIERISVGVAEGVFESK